MRRILSKFLMIVLIMLILLNMSANTIYAAVKINMNKKLIETIGTADNHLKYYREKTGKYTYHTTILMGYKGEEGRTYPVYCVDRDLPGADEGSYYINTENILNNNKIWRIVKNGYPFKTAKEWGLTDEKNVYAITRFAIYCVLGQEKLEYFKAESDDKEAVAMLKALKQLVNIGENGTEKQNDNPISIEKIGTFIEKGSYYLQQYNVTSTSDFNKYEISKASGMPSGAYIADLNGKEKNTFSNGEDFFVMIPKAELNKDININIKVEAECRSYLILDGKSTVEGKQNYAVTMGEYANIEAETNLKINVNTAKVNIFKMDEETKKGIEGVEFEIINEKGEIIDKKVTDSQGKIEFKNLIQGKYKIKETKANDKYIKLEKDIETEVEYNQIKNVNITNEHKKRKY